MTDMPEFSGNAEERAKSIVGWVEGHLKTQRLTLVRALRLGKKTPQQVITSGELPQIYSCLEKAGTIGAIMAKNGFNTHIISERTYLNNNPVGLHFVVQGDLGGSKVTIDPLKEKASITKGWGFHSAGISRVVRRRSQELVHQAVARTEVPPDAMSRECFKLCGLRNRAEYFKLAGILNPSSTLTVARQFAEKKRYEKAMLRKHRIR
jgi:hypothetical protein